MTGIPDLLTDMDYGPSPEDPGVAMGWLAGHAAGFGHFIDGRFTKPGHMFEVRNPATGGALARVTQGTAADVDRAVRAARKAQPGWAKLSGHDRARHLYALARHVQQHARFLAVLETLDTGKPIRESRDSDLPLVARHFYHHAGWAEVLTDEFPNAVPHGVCGQVIPWNFPLLMLAWKVAPALAAGNTVVLKPAEYTPLTALAFAEIAREAGLPNGVLNIVTGDGATGALLTGHAGVDKVAFTGSTEVGRAIREQTAGSGKALSLELGGKSPFVVFADADLDAAVEGVVDSIWFNQGEVCCAGSRILVAEPVAERFEALLVRRMERLRTGDPLDKSTDIGAIVHPVQLDRIRELVARGEAEGATLHRGSAPEGCYFPPTLATGVAPASTLWREEIFGPVVTLTPFRTPDEAVELANNTRYGLAASVWSESAARALDVAGRIRAGVVWINGANVFDAGAPFGGMGESGFGREGGREGMAAYLAPPRSPLRRKEAAEPLPAPIPAGPAGAAGGIDRTAKLYIGGKQQRPDGGHVWPVAGGLAALGNRKDIRNAVEAARKAEGWSRMPGHGRAQVLYYLAENLSARRGEFADRLAAFGQKSGEARTEVEASIRRIFWYAAQADKVDGRVPSTRAGMLTLSLPGPLGVVGLGCPAAYPLLGFVSLVLPLIAMGNRVVAVPSPRHPLAATDFYQLLDTSDMPGGVVNIVTGPRETLCEVLAAHDGVEAIWYFGTAEGATRTEVLSAATVKRTWTEDGGARDWAAAAGQGRRFLDEAIQSKTVWLPFGA